MPVPEPTTCAVLLSATAMAFLMRRRRRGGA
ncbi:MAG: PEP-CTERM sorting domain-containing protein [Pirellulales bacterium]